MHVRVITPAYLEAYLQIAQNACSVKMQATKIVNCSQLIFFDGVSPLTFNLSSIQNDNAQVLYTRFNHNDFGDHIRALGTRVSLRSNIDAITFLDADNSWSDGHLQSILAAHKRTKKNIIVSQRKLIDENGTETIGGHTSFFDTNTITLFGNFKKIGLMWGKYPREMSLIGDRIISQYIKTHFPDEIAYTSEATVLYRYSKIPRHKIEKFKSWYRARYPYIASEFRNRFGFDVKI